MKQQVISRPPRGPQIAQDIHIALRVRWRWLITSGIILALLLAGVIVGASIGLSLSAIILFLIPSCIILGILVLYLFLLLLTTKRQKVNAYRKAVRRSLAKAMESYYPPGGSSSLNGAQEQHMLVLGLPGSGKTKSLEYLLYSMTEAGLQRTDSIPILIQMKYYNGFLRQHQPHTTATAQTSTETLLAYLLDNKHQQKAQQTKEPELVGMQHLRPYLRHFFSQGRILFLCDGMNELEINALKVVHDELIPIMQTKNRVIMTCRELEYQEQDLLQDFTRYGATVKMLSALAEDDVPHIVDRYLDALGTSRKQIERTKEQISKINQPHRYTSPFMLIMLLQALNQLDEKQAQTISRGYLLKLSIDQRLTGEDGTTVRRFLSVVACTARRNEQRNAIQLSNNRKPLPLIGFAEYLKDWLEDNEADEHNYTPLDIQKFLGIAYDVGLITISNYGVLSFMHELIAEYFAAEYLSYVYHEKRESNTFWESIYTCEAKAAGIWSEPVALWAGLEKRPMDVAKFLISWAETYNRQYGENDDIYYHALALSLACVGVKAPDVLPQSIQKYLEKFVLGKAERVKLAKIFKRCADEGGAEVYGALLPLIDAPGLPDLFLELHDLHCKSNDSLIPPLLFDYLEKVMPQTTQPDQVLISLLGELGKRPCGELVRARAQAMLGNVVRSIPLRMATITILGHIKNADDVQLLVKHLQDQDREQRLAGATIGALRMFGPELTLEALVEREKSLRSPEHAQTRFNLLTVLQHFLSSAEVQSRLSQSAYKLIIHTTMQFLSSCDDTTTRQTAFNLLHEQMQKDKQRISIVTRFLLATMATPDEQQARYIQELCKKNYFAIFTYVTEYWNTQTLTELARVRIIEFLGEVPDRLTRYFLLQQLNDTAISVQDALCQALSRHRPESISPLLRVILVPNTTTNANRVAVNTLREIGTESIVPICEELLQLQSHAQAPEAGLRSLVVLLHHFRENALVPDGIREKVVTALITLLQWLVDNTRYAQLAAYLIEVMVGFRHPLTAPPLIALLARSETEFNGVYKQASKGLSALADIALVFHYLIEALNSQAVLLTGRVRQVLLEAKPFPYDDLLSAFNDPREVVVSQIRQVFTASQHMPQTAPFLVSHLFDRDNGNTISSNVQRTLKAMQPDITMPHLVKALGKVDWQVILEPLLLGCPEPALVIPLLVEELGDAQQQRAAGEVLLKFPPALVLPWLMTGLERSDASQYTRWLIVQMISLSRQQHTNLLPNVVQLFDSAVVQRASTPSEARRALHELLTHELADFSLPALINGLAEQALMEDCTISLVALADEPGKLDDVLAAVLQALRNPQKCRGAHNTLVRCGELAAKQVCDLLQDNDVAIIEEARTILAEMGKIAFPYIYQLAHHPQHISDARKIFTLMPATTVANGLLSFLASNDMQEIEIAFYLLSVSIEQAYRSGRFDITKAILQQTLEQPASDVRLRILTVLLFFNSNTQQQQRSKIAEQLIEAITHSPEYHAECMRAISLLGKQAEAPLVEVITAQRVPIKVQLEAIGTLGTISAHPQITGLVKDLAARTSSHMLQTANAKTLDLRQQEWGLRALGGLLASGIYDMGELVRLQHSSKISGDHTAREFYEVLLGTRNLPHIEQLAEQIQQCESTIADLERHVQQQKRRANDAESRADAADARASNAERHANNLQAEIRRLRDLR